MPKVACTLTDLEHRLVKTIRKARKPDGIKTIDALVYTWVRRGLDEYQASVESAVQEPAAQPPRKKSFLKAIQGGVRRGR